MLGERTGMGSPDQPKFRLVGPDEGERRGEVIDLATSREVRKQEIMGQLYDIQERLGSEMGQLARATHGDVGLMSICHEMDGLLREFARLTLRSGGVSSKDWQEFLRAQPDGVLEP